MTDPGPRGGVDDDGSIVAGRRGRPLSTLQKLGIAGLVAGVFLAFIWISQLDKAANKDAPQPDVAVGIGGSFRPAPSPAPPPPPTTLPMPAATAGSPMPQPQNTAAESPIFAYTGGSAAAPHTAEAVSSVTPDKESRPNAAGAPEPPSMLGTKLRPTVLSVTKARLLPHPDMLVTEGTMIPCILQTAIDTQLAGYVKCVLPADVRGTTGNVVLLDRGTIVVGEIRDGLVLGEDRVFVVWDRAETPDHAVIDVSSPGTDELGRSGLPGQVDNHWWDRFGDAILLSFIQGGLEATAALAANSSQNSSAGSAAGGTTINSFSQNGANISNTALQAEINIPPTLEKNQGDTVAIFVAHDLDFSDVYQLRVKTGARTDHGQ